MGEEKWEGEKLGPVPEFANSDLGGTVVAAEHLLTRLHTMPNNGHAAVATTGRQFIDGAFKTVKRVGLAVHVDFKGAVILVSAGFTSGHG